MKRNLLLISFIIFFSCQKNLDWDVYSGSTERTQYINSDIINKDNIKLMKKKSVIINTSRGPIIKERDLIDALNNEIISCAALDVYDIEPLPKNHILRNTKNLILIYRI